MTIQKAFEKIIRKYGEDTYAEVHWTGRNYKQRLDLALAVEVETVYEYLRYHENISTKVFPNRYRLSEPEAHETYCTYTIYTADDDGVLLVKATVDVYPDYVYANYDWRERFKNTRYPRHGIPWWADKYPWHKYL